MQSQDQHSITHSGPTTETVLTTSPQEMAKIQLKKGLQEFLLFIREQGVVGLAIAFILGGAVNKVVTSLVADIIQPIIGLIFGSPSGLVSWNIGPIRVGSFLAVAIDFAIIAWVVYFIFKKLNLESLDKKKS